LEFETLHLLFERLQLLGKSELFLSSERNLFDLFKMLDEVVFFKVVDRDLLSLHVWLVNSFTNLLPIFSCDSFLTDASDQRQVLSKFFETRFDDICHFSSLFIILIQFFEKQTAVHNPLLNR